MNNIEKSNNNKRFIQDIGDQYTRIQLFLVKSCPEILKKIDQRLKSELLKEAIKKKKEENIIKKPAPQSIQFTMIDYLTKFEP